MACLCEFLNLWGPTVSVHFKVHYQKILFSFSFNFQQKSRDSDIKTRIIIYLNKWCIEGWIN